MNNGYFSIGAVARMVGVSSHALRKWEDRYRAVRPSRSAGGDRRYTSDDVDRLSKLKALTDKGHPISSLAPLSQDELDGLISKARPAIGEPQRVSVGVVGERMTHELREATAHLPGFEIDAQATGIEALDPMNTDVVVIELGSIGADTENQLGHVRATTGVDCVVVVYGYGSMNTAEHLSDAHTALVRRPINPYELVRTTTALVGASIPAAPRLGLPPHRFTREVLGRMAMISPELACECPRHVGQILIELTDFEQYSAECEINKPADAHLHNMLRRTAASSRALFENALVELAEAEGIPLDDARTETQIDTGRGNE